MVAGFSRIGAVLPRHLLNIGSCECSSMVEQWLAKSLMTVRFCSFAYAWVVKRIDGSLQNCIRQFDSGPMLLCGERKSTAEPHKLLPRRGSTGLRNFKHQGSNRNWYTSTKEKNVRTTNARSARVLIPLVQIARVMQKVDMLVLKMSF